MTTRKGDWIQTFTGISFWPLDPRPDEILIQDIAHALSMQCRFTGHVKYFYSVAEHSVHVSRVCLPEDALWGLLHDASEAYLADVAGPLKRFMPEYVEAEANLQRAFARRFDLSEDEPESVRIADQRVLAAEVRDLLSPMPYKLESTPPADLRINPPWSPQEAKDRFMTRFNELITQRNMKKAQSNPELADSMRMDWLEAHGSSLGYDFFAGLQGKPAWYTSGKGAKYKRPRYLTAREAIDAAMREVIDE